MKHSEKARWYEAIAMTAPGIVAPESALQEGVPLEVPSFDKA